MKKFSWKHIIEWTLLLVCILLLLQRCVLSKPSKNISFSKFTFQDQEGNLLSSEDYKNQVVFLNFWAEWCPPCRAEMPSIKALAKQFENRDVKFVFVNIDSKNPTSDIPAGDISPNIQYVSLVEYPKQLDISTIPVTYIFDRDKKIVDSHVGFYLWNNPLTKRKIEKLLSE